MSGTTARTGRLGKVVIEGSLVKRTTEWSLNESVGESAWGDSDSEGYTNRLAGRIDGTGNISGKFDTEDEQYNLFRRGDIVVLVLWQSTTAGDYWYFGSALIQNFQLTYNQDTQEVVGWTASFGADGKFYAPGEAGAPAATLPA